MKRTEKVRKSGRGSTLAFLLRFFHFSAAMAMRDRSEDFREFRLRIRREGFGTVPSSDLMSPNDRSVGWMENVHDIEYDIQRVENMSLFLRFVPSVFFLMVYER